MDIVDITSEDIDVASVLLRLSDPSCGASACFLGTTRDSFEGKRVLHLEYEAYPSMALRELRRIASEMRMRWALTGVALLHRTGTVAPTKASVLVVATSVHRVAALEAVRYGIDAIKSEVPIWKKETYDDGTCCWKENCLSKDISQ